MSVGGSTTNSPAFTLFPYVPSTVPATKVDRPKRNRRALEIMKLNIFFIGDLHKHQFTARTRVKLSSPSERDGTLVKLS
jgi:hypothetical protein